MKRLRILLVGLVLLVAFGFLWMSKAKPGEVLTSYTFVAIDAPADKAWNILTDVSHYPDWNPYIVKVDGTLSSAAKLTIESRSEGKSESHRVRVTRFDPAGHQFSWQGASIFSGLLSWSEQYSVEALDANHCRVTVAESHQGLLANWYWKSHKNRGLASHRLLGAALKKKAEQQ